MIGLVDRAFTSLVLAFLLPRDLARTAAPSPSTTTCYPSRTEQEVPTEPYYYDTSALRKLQDTCWAADSWTHIPRGPFMAPILQGLVSPAPQSMFTLQHALNFAASSSSSKDDCNDDDAAAYKIGTQVVYHCQHLIKPTHRLVVRSSHKSAIAVEGWGQAGRDWTIARYDDDTKENDWIRLDQAVGRPTTNQMAAAMVEHREPHTSCTDTQMMMNAFRERLWYTLATELRGRSAADAALWLALAGCADDDTTDTLFHTVHLEILRHQRRSSFSSLPLVHAVEKMVAAGGTIQPETRALLSTVLLHGREKLPRVLWDDRPLLWLWRTAARLPRATTTTTSNMEAAASSSTSRNSVLPPSILATTTTKTTKPLVIDLGCGFGVSLLQLAATASNENNQGDEYHYLGCDTHPIAVQYARGMARRWNVTDRLTIVQASTDQVLRELLVLQRRGAVVVDRVLLQFPTPFRLIVASHSRTSSEVGNTQLPDQETFMGSQSTIQRIAQLLLQQQKNHGSSNTRCPQLLIQSNCEDVAVQLAQWAVQAGLSRVPAPHPVMAPANSTTARTQRWLAHSSSNNPERAVGPHWSRVPLLDTRSETEVACAWEGVPIHRCLLTSES